MPHFLNVSSQLMCPHGGTVSAVSSNARVKTGGDLVVRSGDTFLVGGCPFMIGPSPHPCMEIQWLVAAELSQAAGDHPVTEGSSGLCKAGDQAPQGPPQVVQTQTQGGGT
jgi:hypothetical protein